MAAAIVIMIFVEFFPEDPLNKLPKYWHFFQSVSLIHGAIAVLLGEELLPEPLHGHGAELFDNILAVLVVVDVSTIFHKKTLCVIIPVQRRTVGGRGGKCCPPK